MRRPPKHHFCVFDTPPFVRHNTPQPLHTTDNPSILEKAREKIGKVVEKAGEVFEETGAVGKQFTPHGAAGRLLR